jgi:hypothetical protein
MGITMDEEVTGRAKGGVARAAALTPERRGEIAKQAVQARWLKHLPTAIYGSPDRPVRVGNVELQCYVLDDDDKTRVLTQAGFLEALGRHRKANVRDEGTEEPTPPILQGKAIRPFISHDLLEKSRPIKFRLKAGVGKSVIASGYRAEILPMVCDVYLKARDEKALPHNQLHVAKQADLLIRALAHVGIIALVDEATGYQEVRAKDALVRILEEFIAKELQPYVPTFQGDYYREIFRLRGLEYPRDPVKRPQYFGSLTNDIVYKRLAPGVLEELKRVTPRLVSGRHKDKLFQRLTRNKGYPKLREHLGAVVTMMQLSNSWHDFMAKIDRLRPRLDIKSIRRGQQLSFDYDSGKDIGTGL